MNMKSFGISVFLLSLIVITGKAYAQEEHEFAFGVEGGAVWADLDAEHTAQRIANISGSTVTYTEDQATWIARGFVDFAVNKNILIEAGGFYSGSLDATYTLSGVTASEGYTLRGFDTSIVLQPDEAPIFVKAGIHVSEVAGEASITIGGTTYSVNAAESGIGGLLGIGYQTRGGGFRAGITYYNRIGGMDDVDVVMGFIGYKF